MNATQKLEILFSAEKIQHRVMELGAEISRDYAHCELHLVGILKGSFVFLADLARALTIPCFIDFLQASSYGSRQTSSGEVLIDHCLNLGDRHILLIEDIIDTGLTLDRVVREIQMQKPASLSICALLDKPEARCIPVTVRYTGFSVPNDFVVGYGIDCNEHYRELPYIAKIVRIEN